MSSDIWFFDRSKKELGFRSLLVGFNKHKNYRYPKLLVHNACSENGGTKTLSYDEFTFNDKYYKSAFKLAVSAAYKAHVKLVYLPIANKLGKESGDHSKALLELLCEDQYKEAMLYVESEEFFDRVHKVIVEKSKRFAGGMRDVITSPFWIRQGTPTWVTFGAQKSSSKCPTIQIGYKSNDIEINQRRVIHSYYGLFLHSACYAAQILHYNKEVQHEFKMEYVLSLYFTLCGHWRELCLSYGFEVSAEIERYGLGLGKWLERINIEFGFVSGSHENNVLSLCLTDAGKPYIYSAQDIPRVNREYEESDMSRRNWLALAHSFGDEGFTYSQISHAMNTIGYSYSKSRLQSIIVRECKHIDYVRAAGRLVRVYKATSNV